MRYMLSIHQGSTPTPGSEAWARCRTTSARRCTGRTGRSTRPRASRRACGCSPPRWPPRGRGGPDADHRRSLCGELAGEAIRLGRALTALLPDEPKLHGLIALMLVHDARRDARVVDGTVVLAEAGDAEAALALVGRLDLDEYHDLHATRAELLRRLGRVADACAAYGRALELVRADAGRRFLERRLAALRPTASLSSGPG